MKKLLLFFLAALTLVRTAEVSAQALKTAYFMEGAISRTQLNPALRPYRGYVHLPGAGGVGVDFSSNALSVRDVVYRNTEDKVVPFWDSSVDADRLFSSLKDNNRLSLNNSVAILGFGSHTRRGHFWSFDINLRTQLDVSLPREAFEMIKFRNGLADYCMENLSIAATSYVEAGFGYAFGLLDDRLRVGAKAKFLMGFVRARMNYDRIEATRRGMEWNLSSEGSLDIPMFMLGGEEDDEAEMHPGRVCTDNLGFNSEYLDGPMGYGFSIDLGATFEVIPHLTVSASLTDLGMLVWNREDMYHGTADTDYTVSANDSGGPDVNDLFSFESADPTSRTDRLWSSLNIGAEYDFPHLPFSVGLLSTNMWRHKQMLSEITGSFNLRPCHWFGLSLSCTASRAGVHPGAALNLYPAGINLFIGTDNLLFREISRAIDDIATVNARTADLYMGLSISLGRGKPGKPRYGI